MYAKGSSSMQQTHFQNIHNTVEETAFGAKLECSKYEEEGFGKSLLHVLFQTFKNVRNTIMYTRCEYNYTNKRNT